MKAPTWERSTGALLEHIVSTRGTTLEHLFTVRLHPATCRQFGLPEGTVLRWTDGPATTTVNGKTFRAPCANPGHYVPPARITGFGTAFTKAGYFGAAASYKRFELRIPGNASVGATVLEVDGVAAPHLTMAAWAAAPQVALITDESGSGDVYLRIPAATAWPASVVCTNSAGLKYVAIATRPQIDGVSNSGATITVTGSHLDLVDRARIDVLGGASYSGTVVPASQSASSIVLESPVSLAGRNVQVSLDVTAAAVAALPWLDPTGRWGYPSDLAWGTQAFFQGT